MENHINTMALLDFARTEIESQGNVVWFGGEKEDRKGEKKQLQIRILPPTGNVLFVSFGMKLL